MKLTGDVSTDAAGAGEEPQSLDLILGDSSVFDDVVEKCQIGRGGSFSDAESGRYANLSC